MSQETEQSNAKSPIYSTAGPRFLLSHLVATAASTGLVVSLLLAVWQPRAPVVGLPERDVPVFDVQPSQDHPEPELDKPSTFVEATKPQDDAVSPSDQEKVVKDDKVQTKPPRVKVNEMDFEYDGDGPVVISFGGKVARSNSKAAPTSGPTVINDINISTKDGSSEGNAASSGATGITPIKAEIGTTSCTPNWKGKCKNPVTIKGTATISSAPNAAAVPDSPQ